MVHTKFQGHPPLGSREDFKRFLPYMDIATILVMRPGTFEDGPFEDAFVPQFLKFGFNRPSGNLRKRSLKILNPRYLDQSQ